MKQLNGWLNINKPLGCSSAQIVARVKKIFKPTKIGHAGTLDPLASGVLPLALGEATKLSQYLMDAKKTYNFTIQFGEQRDTGDKEGKVINTITYIPTEQDCKEIINKFVGIIEQIPPQYSALKINGKRAYQMAREGQEFILKSREIKIYSLKLVNYSEILAQATYLAECSKGTYIRTLAEDIAKSLQSLGFVIKLTRLQVGPFSINHAIDLEQLANLEDELLLQAIENIDKVLGDILALEVDDIMALKIRCGQKLNLEEPDQGCVWLKNNENLLAIGSIKDRLFHSSRVFNL